jgi:mono/diheme cytochrome c family protein
MNGVNLLFLSHYRRHLLLLGVAPGFILGCSEPPPPVPKTILAPSRPLSTLSNTVSTPPPVAKPKQQTQTIEMRKLDPEKVKRGEVIYEANCATCHGPKGESTPGWKKQGADGKYPPPPLNGSAHTWHHSTETLEKMIREGSPSGMGGMPAWGDKLTDQEINDVTVWITSLWPDKEYNAWYQEIEQKHQKKKHHQ